MTAGGQWRASRAVGFTSHDFPEGVVLYDLQSRSTMYLPHPAGEVFSVLKRSQQGLDGVHILDALADSGSRTALAADELEAVLVELQRLRLITACP